MSKEITQGYYWCKDTILGRLCVDYHELLSDIRVVSSVSPLWLIINLMPLRHRINMNYFLILSQKKLSFA